MGAALAGGLDPFRGVLLAGLAGDLFARMAAHSWRQKIARCSRPGAGDFESHHDDRRGIYSGGAAFPAASSPGDGDGRGTIAFDASSLRRSKCISPNTGTLELRSGRFAVQCFSV